MAGNEHTNEDPAGFRTLHEAGYVLDIDATKPALLINPHASLVALMAAATSRASRLNKALWQWATVEDCSPIASEVASTLQPLAEEVTLLLDAIEQHVKSGAVASARS